VALDEAHHKVEADHLAGGEVVVEEQLELDEESERGGHVDPLAELSHVDHVLDDEQEGGHHRRAQDEPVAVLVLEERNVFPVVRSGVE